MIVIFVFDFVMNCGWVVYDIDVLVFVIWCGFIKLEGKEVFQKVYFVCF